MQISVWKLCGLWKQNVETIGDDTPFNARRLKSDLKVNL